MKSISAFRVIVSFSFFILVASASAQFAHTDHKQIVDASGKPLLIRATNLGNWMVPEGYMWLLHDGPQSAGEIRALVLELLGPEASDAFWKKYRENYITRDDIAFLHHAGFNAIRVPMHHALFETDDAEGFRLLDQLITWCRAEQLYVILDLHAAPGGQTGANIDDSPGYPWLYESPREQDHLFAIWRRLAKHYPNEPAILGYDLLNEPIPHYPRVETLNPLLEPLYKRLVAEIRKDDTHHILFLGGAQWDSNFSVFSKPFDSNLAYTFHKYWTASDESVIQPYLKFRDQYDVPIWLGESGENTDEWIAQFVKTLEKNNIGWAFWPYKKMSEKSSSVVTITPPADWDKIVAFAKLPRGTGHVEDRLKVRPDQETINRAFAEFLENIRLQKCRVNEGYLKALGLNSDVAPASTGLPPGTQSKVVLSKLSEPVYPRTAQAARISGDVDVELSIGPNGRIEAASATSGPAMLKPVALDSAQQSQFECSNCTEGVTYSLTYRFQLLEPASCDALQEKPLRTELDIAHNLVTISARPPLICDPVEKITETHFRSSKCLYLWRCAHQRID